MNRIVTTTRVYRSKIVLCLNADFHAPDTSFAPISWWYACRIFSEAEDKTCRVSGFLAQQKFKFNALDPYVIRLSEKIVMPKSLKRRILRHGIFMLKYISLNVESFHDRILLADDPFVGMEEREQNRLHHFAALVGHDSKRD